MQLTDATPRERRKAQTWASISEAAAALAIEKGLAGATIEDISGRAQVSRRTFFNYFPCKEDAVLGTQPPTVPDEARARYLDVTSGDRFARTVRLLAAVTLTSIRDDHDLARRRELAAIFPELRARLGQHVAAAERLVDEIVDDRPLVILAGSVIRFVFARDTTPNSADSPRVVDDAITMFRTLMKEVL